MSEMHADLKAAQKRILALKHNHLELEEACRRTAERLIQVERRLSDANGEVLRLGLQLKHHMQLQAERDALAVAIRDAAVKAGICRPDADLTGPMLTMLCADMGARLAELEQQKPIGWFQDVNRHNGQPPHYEHVADSHGGQDGTFQAFRLPVPAGAPDSHAAPWLAWALHVIRGRCPDVVTSFQFERAEAARASWFAGKPGGASAESAPKAVRLTEADPSTDKAAQLLAIVRAEAALKAPKPDALEQARAEEREACVAIAKEAVEGATVSKYATPREARAARGMAAHLLDAIRARRQA